MATRHWHGSGTRPRGYRMSDSRSGRDSRSSPSLMTCGSSSRPAANGTEYAQAARSHARPMARAPRWVPTGVSGSATGAPTTWAGSAAPGRSISRVAAGRTRRRKDAYLVGDACTIARSRPTVGCCCTRARPPASRPLATSGLGPSTAAGTRAPRLNRPRASCTGSRAMAMMPMPLVARASSGNPCATCGTSTWRRLPGPRSMCPGPGPGRDPGRRWWWTTSGPGSSSSAEARGRQHSTTRGCGHSRPLRHPRMPCSHRVRLGPSERSRQPIKRAQSSRPSSYRGRMSMRSTNSTIAPAIAQPTIATRTVVSILSR